MPSHAARTRPRIDRIVWQVVPIMYCIVKSYNYYIEPLWPHVLALVQVQVQNREPTTGTRATATQKVRLE